ncbi:hypothetical protein T265_02505 [Opisthorchis viverrini]|uniref:Phosphoglycerate mutase family protein n=2 Tax=Opisthorchis viverrini TaxID=6198 RepID=A0A075AI82_OPIVI|nr:hypothetical protein T265_02505 [Opisthorchis viverrini]KER31179.1 hypothetical protein T265_02505 [Opisthorchis viverrini]
MPPEGSTRAGILPDCLSLKEEVERQRSGSNYGPSGHMDTSLSPVGLSQAQDLKVHMNSLPIDVVISSDLKRASMTAEALGLSIPLELDSRLRERNFGRYCGAPRGELQEFAERNARTGGGCDGWRAVGGECSHEMAHRTSTFLLDFCSRLVQGLRNEEPLSDYSHASVQPPIFRSSSRALMPEPVQDCFGDPDNHTFRYAGHALMVSHGGWIRHFLRLMALQAEHSFRFPKQCLNSVMNNCGICQIGIAFDVAQFLAFRNQQPPTQVTGSLSPLPVFGNLLESPDQEHKCQFHHLAHQRFPLFTVCYNFNLTKSDLDMKDGKNHSASPSNKAANDLCGRMEVIFSDDGDEYTGMPTTNDANRNS